MSISQNSSGVFLESRLIKKDADMEEVGLSPDPRRLTRRQARCASFGNEFGKNASKSRENIHISRIAASNTGDKES